LCGFLRKKEWINPFQNANVFGDRKSQLICLSNVAFLRIQKDNIFLHFREKSYIIAFISAYAPLRGVLVRK